MSVADDIKQALAAALQKEGLSGEATLEHPAELIHGDYASGIALAKSKEAGMNPRALAEKIVANFGEIPGVAKIDIAGPGFINFTLSPEVFAATIDEARSADTWGSGSTNAGKKIMVEYTDPNPFKEFHIGHLMSNAIGESISRLLQFEGAEVKRVNYQGDVGPHVAKAIWGVRKLGMNPDDAKALGKAYATGAQAYENDPAAKAEIDEINAKVYDRSDDPINGIYDAGRAASLAHFEEIYAVLGTKFDNYFFESKTAPKGIETVQAHPEVFEESEGARVYKGEKHGLHTRVFITSKGLPTYETKDLGLVQLKDEYWPFDISVTITAVEQKEYFRVVLAAMKEVLPELAAKVRHVSHGLMQLAEGKMSSRSGNVITGESLLDDLVESANERAAESRADDKGRLAQDVSIAAIKYQILKQASGKNIIFDRERALSLEGDSGPYLQYAFARTQAIMAKAKEQGIVGKCRTSDVLHGHEVARFVYRFPEIVAYATSEMEPHLVTTYLTQLAAAFNTWYAQEQILDGTPSAAHKVALVEAVGRTLKNGLWLLGIPAPEKM
ncbi:arginine--tRNA ligase [Candidatus Kaiserbacteria bacterium]|nr:arginine--tRNA ligase [Candidatus Kaiserbacteria bacterium]